MQVRILLVVMMLTATIAKAQTTGIVYFNFNSTSLTGEARAELNKLVAGNKLQSLGIFGHTDQVGTDEYNEWLSLQRARAVRDYLESRGVNAGRISVVMGCGARRLISDGKDDLSMQLNRRVVLMNNYKPTDIDKEIAARQATITERPNMNATSSTAEAAVPAPTANKAQPTIPQQPIAKGTEPVKREEPVVKQQRSERLVEDIQDKATKAGEHIVLKNINFHPGRNVFLENAYPALQDLAEAMQKIPTLEIEIQGHVCCTEDETDALDIVTGIHNLSTSRAKAVYDYLLQKGIAQSRVSFKGLARQYPLVKVEQNEDDRIMNRRVEIKILRK
ncbi:OmpA family protein [Aridibaculum aurantiacum]|uniref:OmpA family protein n=1 Tax=Aridibaculum aurantiacum TaxID=2810307 RepID=UPI001A960947|nr:OmpA family protein [Aridibaculum aurantiacum]